MHNLAIVGYGKMGKLIEKLAGEYDFQVVTRLDEFNNADFSGITAKAFDSVDIAIDFSVPSAVVENVERISALGRNVVVGTTGWLEQLHYLRKVVEQNGTGMIYAANFSVGVNVLTRVVAEAARLLAGQAEYEAWAWEVHHSAKKDAPSGTLLKLVGEMKKAGYSRLIDTSSNRAGKHPGTHEIGFDSSADTITIRHEARSREGFAHGALKAAQWLIGKQGFYEFGDILFPQ